MKRYLLTVCTLCLLNGLALADDQADKAKDDTGPLKTLTDKASYAFGMNIGKSIKSEDVDLNIDVLVRGIRDAIAEKEPLLTEEEVDAVFDEFQKEMIAKQTEKRRLAAEKNKVAGESFLAENKIKDGVKTLESGVQYKVVKSGDGASPGKSDTVTVHYRGTLLDGTEFDSSYKRGEPATFPVDGVIDGWTEALQKMKVGDKWIVHIPADQAYGSQGAGNVIGPNSVLSFEIELLNIEKAAEEVKEEVSE